MISFLSLLLLVHSSQSFLQIRPTRSPLSSILHIGIGTAPKALTDEDKYDNYTRFNEDGKEMEFGWNCEYREREIAEEPDHELYRKKRLTRVTQRCDDWFENLLTVDDQVLPKTIDGNPVRKNAFERLVTPCKLEHDPERQWFLGFQDDEDWSPYGHYRLPGKVIYPAYGLETFGLPIPRPQSETWRKFDVSGMTQTDYSLDPKNVEMDLQLDDIEKEFIISKMEVKGGWMKDEECAARLVYINGRFCTSLSKTTSWAKNLQLDSLEENDEITELLTRLPEGHTDDLPTEPNQEDLKEICGASIYSKLSAPHQNYRRANGQKSINHQLGTACFIALNSAKTGSVAYINTEPCPGTIEKLQACEDREMAIKTKPIQIKRQAIEDDRDDLHEKLWKEEDVKPVYVLNILTEDGGCEDEDADKGVTIHPRVLAVANVGSRLHLVQQSISLDTGSTKTRRKQFCNAVSQIYVRSGAHVKHCLTDETGEPLDNPQTPHPSLHDTHLHSLDIYHTGRYGIYKGTQLGISSMNRYKLASCSLLAQKFTRTELAGMAISSHLQNADMRATMHHVAPLTTCDHLQRNLVGGGNSKDHKAESVWRGRIHMDANAFNADGTQLCKTLLLNEGSTSWALPCLDIICDQVTCCHGATVADISDEELLYLQSRGVSTGMARELLMFGFVDEIGRSVDPNIFGADSRRRGNKKGLLRERITNRISTMRTDQKNNKRVWGNMINM